MPSEAGFPHSRNNYCMFEHLHTRVSSGESVAGTHTHTIVWHLWGNMHSHSRCVAWRPAAHINFATTATTTIAATKGGIITCECLCALCGDTGGRCMPQAFAAINTVDDVSWRPLQPAKHSTSHIPSFSFFLARNEAGRGLAQLALIALTHSLWHDICKGLPFPLPTLLWQQQLPAELIELQLIIPSWHFDDFNDL